MQPLWESHQNWKSLRDIKISYINLQFYCSGLTYGETWSKNIFQLTDFLTCVAVGTNTKQAKVYQNKDGKQSVLERVEKTHKIKPPTIQS